MEPGGATNGTLSAAEVNHCALLQCFQTVKYRKRCSAAPLLAKQIQNTYALHGIKIAPNAQHHMSLDALQAYRQHHLTALDF